MLHCTNFFLLLLLFKQFCVKLCNISFIFQCLKCYFDFFSNLRRAESKRYLSISDSRILRQTTNTGHPSNLLCANSRDGVNEKFHHKHLQMALKFHLNECHIWIIAH